MTVKNAKGKGNSFERLISKQLSNWLTSGADDKTIWRTENSGGSTTIWLNKNQDKTNNQVLANAGDIKKISEKGDYPLVDAFFDRYVLELKHYKSIEFYPPLTKQVHGFFTEGIKEAKQAKKQPIVILRRNSRKILFCVGTEYASKDLGEFTQIPEFFLPIEDYLFEVHLFENILKTPYSPILNETKND